MSSPSRASASLVRPSSAFASLQYFFIEARALVEALLSPGKIIAEVEEMQRLLQQAHRIEASDPARAGMLRRRASRIGLH